MEPSQRQLDGKRRADRITKERWGEVEESKVHFFFESCIPAIVFRTQRMFAEVLKRWKREREREAFSWSILSFFCQCRAFENETRVFFFLQIQLLTGNGI